MKSKLRLLIILGMVLFLGHQAIAQISEKGTPASFSFKNMVDLRSGETFTTPVQFDVAKLKEEDKIAEESNNPLRTAIIIPVDLDVKNNGEWTTLPSGQQIWRLTIQAPDAIAIMLYYDEFVIPEGGKLFIYNEDQSHIIGAYTSKTNPTDGAFATEFVAGDKITLEYNAPFEGLSTQSDVPLLSFKTEKPKIKITGVGYGYNYLRIGRTANILKIGESDACEVNINCPEGDDWQDQKKGVAKSVTPIGSGAFLCSGTLINNTAQDMTPFFLTASHCFWDGSTTLTTPQWSQIMYYFHYESPTCVTAMPTNQRTVVGAQLLVESRINGGSDGVLLQLNGSIPLEWDLYFNGWDKRNVAATSGVGIHHPSGDVKKISTFTGPVSTARWNGSDGSIGAVGAHWQFLFTPTMSGHGVTEGGSSGSPMFNQNGLVVGTLSGGLSSCTNLNGTNLYGKLSFHWDVANQGSAVGVITTNRMMDYLDPLGTGQETLNGTYTVNNLPTANFTASSTNIYAVESIEYTDYSVGATSWQWTFQGGTPATFTGKTPPPIRYNSAGSYTTTLTINSGSGPQETMTENITVTIKGTPAQPVADFMVPDIIYNEDFDVTATWTSDWTIDLHGTTNSWVRGNFSTSFSAIDPANLASACINSASLYSNAWLITVNSFPIGQGSSIEFYTLYDGVWLVNAHMNFLVSADNGTTWTQLWTTGSVATSRAFSWSRNTIDLSSYDGQSLMFAWQYEGASGNGMAVDGIKLFGPVSNVTLNVGDYLTPIDMSTGTPVLWDWTFNGATPVNATGEAPRVQYMTAGVYDISLTVENTIGTDSKTMPNIVTVVDKLPLTAFKAEAPGYTMQSNYGPYIIPGKSVNYIDITPNYPLSWNWTFTGTSPTSSNVQNPQNLTYSTSGLYDVSLVTGNTAGTQTKAEPGFVKVGYDSPTRIWNLMYGENIVASSVLTAAAIGSNVYGGSMFSERFEAPLSAGYVSGVDIKCFKTANTNGNMTVALFTDNNGFPGSQLATVNVAINTEIITATGVAGAQYVPVIFPTPVLVSGPFHIRISGLNSDGSGTTGMNVYIAHSASRGELAKCTGNIYYNSAWRLASGVIQNFNVSLDVVPTFWYSSNSIVDFDAEPAYALKSNNNPYIPTDGTLNFTDLSVGIPPDAWNWTFNGGTPANSTQQNPQIVYSTAGDYDVQLDVTNPEGGSGTLTKTNFVKAELDTYNYIWNLPRGEAGTTTYTRGGAGQYISGQNSYGITAYAERFEAPVQGGKITGAQIQFNRLSTAPSGTITVSVYTDAGGFPGTELTSVDLVANTTNFTANGTGAGNMKTFTFPSPVLVGGPYFIVVSGYSGLPTGGVRNVTVCSSALRDDGINTFYFLDQGTWVDLEDDSQGALCLSLNVAPNFAYTNDIEAGFEAEYKGYIREANYGRFIPTDVTLDFFDRTGGMPVEWNWTFTGGTPGVSIDVNPLQINYNTAGSYPVRLDVKNSAGATDYMEIFDYVRAAYDVDDRIWNMLPGDAGDQLILNAASSYFTGANSAGHDAYAERFDEPLASGYMYGVDLSLASTAASGTLEVSIRKEENGIPGLILASEIINVSSIPATGYTNVIFTNDAYTDGAFYVVVSGFNSFASGTVGIHSSYVLSPDDKNTAFVLTSSGWMPVFEAWGYTNALSLNLAPLFTYSIPTFTVDGISSRFLPGDLSVIRKDVDLSEDTVNVTSDVPWTATTTAGWVTINNGSAAANGQFWFSVANNTTPYPRVAKIIVTPTGLDKMQKVVIIRQASTYPAGLTAAFDSNGDVQVDWTAMPLSAPAPVKPTPVEVLLKSSLVQKQALRDLLAPDSEVNGKRFTTLNAKDLRLRTERSVMLEGEMEVIIDPGVKAEPEIVATPVKAKSSLKAAPANTVVRWDDGYNSDAIGFNSPAIKNLKLEVATLYTAADMITLTLPSGISKIKEVEVYIGTLPINGITLKISQGSIIYKQPVSNSQLTSNAFNTIILNEPFVLDEVSDTYIGYEFYVNGGMFVPGLDAGPAVAGKGDLIADDGGPLYSLYNATGGALSGNWNIAATIETGRVDYYVLYRDGVEITRTILPTATPSYLDTDNLAFGNHCYGIAALFDDLESTPSPDACVFQLSPENSLFTVAPSSLQFAAGGDIQDITVTINDPSGYISTYSLNFYNDLPGWLTGPTIVGNTYTYTVGLNAGTALTGDIHIWLSASGSSTYTTSNGYAIPVTQLAPLSPGMLDYDLSNRTYNGLPQTVSVALNSAYSGLGAITVLYDGSTTAPVNAGTYTISINALSGSNYGAVTGLILGTLTIDPAPLTIRPNDETRAFGAANPTFSAEFTTLLGADLPASIVGLTITTTATTASMPGRYPIMASGGVNPNYTITYVDGWLTIETIDQTIQFSFLPLLFVGDVVYAYATSSVGLTVSFTSSDPSIAEATFNGKITAKAAGTVVITAYSNGNSSYNPASTSQTLVITEKPTGPIDPPDDPTGSEFINASQDIIVYPNPVSKSAPVYVNADVDEALLAGAVITVYSENGSVVKNMQVTGKLTKIDLSVDSGTYLFVLKGKTGIIKTLKVIVK